MPGLAHEIHGAPKWYAESAEHIANEMRKQGAEEYQPYRRGEPSKNAAIKAEIERLLAREQGHIQSIIPFSITGTSKTIKVSPNELREIIGNEGFARRVYESTTGSRNITQEELLDLQQRARNTFQSYLPDIHRLESAGLEEEAHRQVQQQRAQSEEEARYRNERQAYEQHEQKLQKRQLREKKETTERLSRDILQKKLDIQTSINNLPPAEKRALAHYEGNIENLLKASSANPQVHAHYENILKDAIKNREELSEYENKLREVERQPDYVIKPYEAPPPIAPSPLAPGASPKSPSPLVEDLFGRASIEREVNRLQRSTGQIAPMNEWHERSTNMLERSFDDNTMRLSADELREAKKHSELKAVGPLVEASLEGPTDEYMNKYVEDYTKDIRKAIEEESAEEFFKNIAPKINMSFAQMGAFHSGARNKALEEAASEHKRKLVRDLAHASAGARDKAMEHHELQKRRQQSAAHLLGHTTKSEKESHRHQAEMLRQQAVTNQALTQINAASLGQVARAKQEQEQHEIDFERQEFERQRLHPQEKLAREAALLQGLPQPQSQVIQSKLAPSPAPPNLFNAGAGVLSALASGFGQQQQRLPLKKGGSVRRYYANGGSIESGDVGSEIRKLIQENNNYNKEQLAQASQHNPLQSWLHHVGKEMLSNMREDPLTNLGRGTAAAMEHGEVVRQRAANLYDKIQASRLNQYQVLAHYEHLKDQNSLGRSNLAERQKYHQQSLENMKNKNKENNNVHPSLEIGGHKFIPIDSKKDRAQILKDKKSSSSILHELEEIKKASDAYEKANEKLYISPRNQLIGGIGNYLQGQYSNLNGKLPGSKDMRDAAVAKSLLDSKLQKFKISAETKLKGGVLTEGLRNFMEEYGVFPSSDEPLDIYNKKLQDLLEETRKVHEASTLSLESGVHITPHDLNMIKNESPKMKETEEMEETEKMEHLPDIVNMTDPEGNPLTVPKNQVQEALIRGAKLAA